MVGVGGRPFGIAETPMGAGSLSPRRPAGWGSFAPGPVSRWPVPSRPALGETLAGGGRTCSPRRARGGSDQRGPRRGAARRVLGTGSLGGRGDRGGGPRDGGSLRQPRGQRRGRVRPAARAHPGLGPADMGRVVGLAGRPGVSPDGRWLYATSGCRRRGSPGSAGPALPAHRRADEVAAVPGPDVPGTLTVVSSAGGPARPGRGASGGRAGAGAGDHVRGRPGGLGDRRASDALLGSSAALLHGDPVRALIARARVGEAPVGLALVDHGGRIVVADSNRFLARGRHQQPRGGQRWCRTGREAGAGGPAPGRPVPRRDSARTGRAHAPGHQLASGQVELANVAGLP